VKWAEISGNTAFIKMVRYGKELSDLKKTIIGLDQDGYSACKIAEFLSLILVIFCVYGLGITNSS
jgi:hypothetical protein